jgi:peptidoglycan/LPS O-acetylase OafA/YrhL
VLLYHVERHTVPDGQNVGPGLVDAVVTHLWLGVTAFFVLSGFLLYRPFAKATVTRGAWPSWRRYARSRVLRILPAYWVALTIVLVVFQPERISVTSILGLVVGVALVVAAVRIERRAPDLKGLHRVILRATAVVVGTVGALLATAGAVELATYARPELHSYVFLQAAVPSPQIIGPAWTLTIEASFYVLLPFLAAGIHLLARRAPTPAARARRQALMLACLLPIGSIYLSHADHYAVPIALPGYIDQFAIGMLLAVAYAYCAAAGRSVRARWLVAAALTATVVATLVEDLHPRAPITRGFGSSVLYQPLMAVAFACLLGTVVLAARRTVAARALETRWVVYLGVISYGLYLWHDPLILELRDHGLLDHSYPVNVAIVAALSIGAATLSWRLVERHALARKDRPLRLWLRTRAPVDAAPAPIPVAAITPGK